MTLDQVESGSQLMLYWRVTATSQATSLAAESHGSKPTRITAKLLIAKGKEQGYLTYHGFNDHLPEGIVDPEQIEDIVSMINDMGITVHEEAPDADALMMETSNTDEDAAEEAAAALATLDAEFGRTTDPVRMYMREMGTVDLLHAKAKSASPSESRKDCAKCWPL